MLCLIAGINLLSISCGKTTKDNYAKGNFYYTNNFSKDITIRVVNISGQSVKTYKILSKQTFMTFSGGITSDKEANPLAFKPAIGGDTTTIFLTDSLCYSEYYRSGPILNNISSYRIEKVSALEYNFYYTIDSSLLILATKCK